MNATVTRCQAKVKIACGVLLASKLRRAAQYQNCPQNLGTVLRQLHGPKGASKMLRATGHARMVNLSSILSLLGLKGFIREGFNKHENWASMIDTKISLQFS